MASQLNVDEIPSWNKFNMIKRSMGMISQRFILEGNIMEHKMSEEEEVLHQYRNRIDHYDNILTNYKNWEYYKKIINPYEFVYTQKRYEYFPNSVCKLKPLSRSYFKMVEMMDLLEFFKDYPMMYLRTGHVCEGPGGFIEALYDLSKRSNKKIVSSVAMTLKSKQNNIPGWKKASQFLKRNRTIQIIYGEDGTGNIMKPENQQYYIDNITISDNGGKVDIFTADGGFDFSGDYMRQEEMIFPLLVASTKIGFEVLRNGGIFILKIFDFYQKSTMDLLYLLSCHFNEWTLYKPGMSRPCNPEHYFIGKGFIGCTNEIFDVLRLWCTILDNNEKLDSLFNLEYSDDFMVRIMEIRTNSYKSQIGYLGRVFQMIDKNDDEKQIKENLKKNERSSLEWCMRFNVPIYPNHFPLTVE
jgi:23S rRNA U2552 (ribose-2'-O)-methylase RlmE/FtsJ